MPPPSGSPRRWRGRPRQPIPGGIRFLGVGSDEARLTETVSGAHVDLITSDTAAVGVPEPTRLARFSTYLNTGAHLSDDDAYLIAGTIHQQWESLRRDYALLAPVAADAIVPSDSPAPLPSGRGPVLPGSGALDRRP